MAWCFGSAPIWRLAIGVAAVTASAPRFRKLPKLRGTIQVVMRTGQEKRKARPASAGFTKFLPRPP